MEFPFVCNYGNNILQQLLLSQVHEEYSFILYMRATKSSLLALIITTSFMGKLQDIQENFVAFFVAPDVMR